MSSIGQSVNDVSHLPFTVFLLLDHLDPHVRDGHRETVVKSYTALVDRPAERWHAGHVLGNTDDVWVYFVQHLVGLHISIQTLRKGNILTSIKYTIASMSTDSPKYS